MIIIHPLVAVSHDMIFISKYVALYLLQQQQANKMSAISTYGHPTEKYLKCHLCLWGPTFGVLYDELFLRKSVISI